jgi:hypothetical protein
MIDCYVSQMCAMRRKIQSCIFIFDEIEFCKELIIGVFILRIISFVTIKVVGFDLALD